MKTMANYGLGDKAWFIPPEKNPRIGVDRTEGYKSPTPITASEQERTQAGGIASRPCRSPARF